MIELKQVISQVIAFLLMMAILKRFTWKPLLAILEERRAKIRAEFDEIANKKEAAEKLKEEYRNKMADIENSKNRELQEAHKKAKELAKEIQLEALGQAKGIVNKALLDAEREAMKVKEDMKNEVAKMAVAIAEKLIVKKMDQEKKQELVAELIKEVKFDEK
ncbi:F0F1 ATP synthase subunit B [Estrella lausannensis]|uniref:ATP synthase subunit b n=1 Tax=Estrella lausannensis TaxID=483423 RepID=A0A0H5DQU3_9BACT|nr:F0F1 ATP synthase subunit B [Estrella lausannensis]CRX38932.1 ATP synthase subunit b [Estrella lausannensis]